MHGIFCQRPSHSPSSSLQRRIGCHRPVVNSIAAATAAALAACQGGRPLMVLLLRWLAGAATIAVACAAPLEGAAGLLLLRLPVD